MLILSTHQKLQSFFSGGQADKADVKARGISRSRRPRGTHLSSPCYLLLDNIFFQMIHDRSVNQDYCQPVPSRTPIKLAMLKAKVSEVLLPLTRSPHAPDIVRTPTAVAALNSVHERRAVI